MSVLTLVAQDPLPGTASEGGAARAKAATRKKHAAAESSLARELRETREEQAAQKAQTAAHRPRSTP